MRIGSLFSGIGGLELGLERAGVGHVVWQVEKEPFCRAVLAKHWPEAARYEDVCNVGAHNLEPVDLICGGFPCQDLSLAGNRSDRRGLDGERSGLWSEFARIVRELRPRYVVVENVTALLDGELGTVLADMAALGFDAEWDCIPAATVGAPQRRDRLFVVAYPNGIGRSGNAERDFWPTGRIAAPQRRHIDGLDLVEAGPWSSLPDVLRVDYGTAGVVDRLRAAGNAVVPQVAELVGHIVLEIEAGQR